MGLLQAHDTRAADRSPLRKAKGHSSKENPKLTNADSHTICRSPRKTAQAATNVHNWVYLSTITGFGSRAAVQGDVTLPEASCCEVADSQNGGADFDHDYLKLTCTNSRRIETVFCC